MNSFFHWTDTRDKSQVSPLAQVHLTGDDNQIMWVKWPALYGMNKITYLLTQQQRQIRCYLFQILQTLLPHNWAVYRIKKTLKIHEYFHLFLFTLSNYFPTYYWVTKPIFWYSTSFNAGLLLFLLLMDLFACLFGNFTLFFLLKYMTKNKDKLIRISFLYCSFVAHLKRHSKLET